MASAAARRGPLTPLQRSPTPDEVARSSKIGRLLMLGKLMEKHAQAAALGTAVPDLLRYAGGQPPSRTLPETWNLTMLDHMKQLLIAVDDETARRLEQVAPGRDRRRSEFVRLAIKKALWELQEHATAEAYRRRPDVEPAYIDPQVWTARDQPRRRRTRKR